MIDIKFYEKVFEIKQNILSGKVYEKNFLIEKFEEFRSKEPVVYNIETTNACNMKCKMCPRTTMMTRKVESLSQEIFDAIAKQLRPWNPLEWERWQLFVESNYKINRNDMSENHFFLHIIPKVIVLHGYGDPLLDKHLDKRIISLREKNIPSYFSCNPSNINIEKSIQMFREGLGYIKYSIESTDDVSHKEIRGEQSNFSDSYKKIIQLLNEKEKNNLDTNIVITMLNLKNENQNFEKLKEKFKGMNVYIYCKSQDQQWYQNKNPETESIHWIEFCQFPWSSMTIKSNGETAMCVEDYNNEIILGNSNTEKLSDIWNGEKYLKLRQNHFNMTSGIKCTERCDMKLIGEYL